MLFTVLGILLTFVLFGFTFIVLFLYVFCLLPNQVESGCYINEYES